MSCMFQARTYFYVVLCDLMRVHHQTTLEIVGDDEADMEVEREVEDEDGAYADGIFPWSVQKATVKSKELSSEHQVHGGKCVAWLRCQVNVKVKCLHKAQLSSACSLRQLTVSS